MLSGATSHYVNDKDIDPVMYSKSRHHFQQALTTVNNYAAEIGLQINKAKPGP